jgi:hypothetical protein
MYKSDTVNYVRLSCPNAILESHPVTELELEAGPDGPLEDAAVSILVACRVDAAQLITGLGFWWSNTGS